MDAWTASFGYAFNAIFVLSGAARLEVRQVVWGPSRDRTIIGGISFDAAPSSVTVIVGANGSGKSSLLRCLYRQNRPNSGQVLLDGEDIWRMRPRDVARRMAAILQETPSDFPFTVREVVEMGRVPHQISPFSWGRSDEQMIARMIARFELGALANQQFSLLSGGEKQRVLLARALVQEPRLIFLDEPTNHLDIRHQLEVLQVVRSLDMTIIMTLHDLELAAELADQILVLRDGRILGAGKPQEVLTPQILRRAYDVASQIDHHPRSGKMRFSFYLPDEAKC